MSDDGSRPPWTDDQWAQLQRTAVEAARRARGASTFLPLVGPLPDGQASVPALTMREQLDAPEWYTTSGTRLQIDDAETLNLTSLSSEVFVRTQQAHDPDLASVHQMIGRAAVVIARLEDAVVLRGQPAADVAPTNNGSVEGEPVVTPQIYRVRGGGAHDGLLQAAARTIPVERAGEYGSNLVDAVVAAIDELESKGQFGPFGAMLGHELYEAAHRPSQGSLVLPSDRFVPFLAGGPLLRSSVLPRDEGVIVATAGSPIDLVIATDIHVGYLQRTMEPRYVLRVSERMVLRLKQRDAVARLAAHGSTRQAHSS
jgi:uncharacterized linocin/CFP29 family protein